MNKSNVKEINFSQLYINLESFKTDTILIVIDDTIYSKYKYYLNFNNRNKYYLYKIKSSEDNKSFEQYRDCVEYFIQKGIHRNTHLVAIGGGVVGDIAGFVASTLLRGISWSIVPTTLLSMIDSSIGGKVGININGVKNQLGAFHIPENIWINLNFLETLNIEQIRSGYGEVIKYAFLDYSINSMFLKDKLNIRSIIYRCIEYKQNIVNNDLFESSSRKFLNLGHTFGHIFEKIYNIPHGIAVIIGIATIFSLFSNSNLLSHLKYLCYKLDIRNIIPWNKFPLEQSISLITSDKKAISKDFLIYVNIEDIGKPSLKKISINDLKTLLKDKYEILSAIRI